MSVALYSVQHKNSKRERNFHVRLISSQRWNWKRLPGQATSMFFLSLENERWCTCMHEHDQTQQCCDSTDGFNHTFPCHARSYSMIGIICQKHHSINPQNKRKKFNTEPSVRYKQKMVEEHASHQQHLAAFSTCGGWASEQSIGVSASGQLQGASQRRCLLQCLPQSVLGSKGRSCKLQVCTSAGASRRPWKIRLKVVSASFQWFSQRCFSYWEKWSKYMSVRKHDSPTASVYLFPF